MGGVLGGEPHPAEKEIRNRGVPRRAGKKKDARLMPSRP